jgi:hypothetical protein
MVFLYWHTKSRTFEEKQNGILLFVLFSNEDWWGFLTKIWQNSSKKLEAQPTEPVSLTWQYNDIEAKFKGR